MSRWQIDDETSALDGKRTITAVLASTEPVLNGIGVADHADLFVGCSGKVFRTGVHWPAFLGLHGADVRWRADDGPIVNDRWDLTDDGEGAFPFGDEKMHAFAAELAKAKRFVIDVTPYKSGESEAVFDLNGADAALARVNDACH